MKRLALALVAPILLIILPLALRPSADWSPSAPERQTHAFPRAEKPHSRSPKRGAGVKEIASAPPKTAANTPKGSR